ncbi:MAG: hypothetical protein ACLFVJ_14180 [Persicimonas sp.]
MLAMASFFMPRANRCQVLVGLLFGTVLLLASACGETTESEVVDSTETQPKELAGTGVQTEDTSDWYGSYIEVMGYNGSGRCTATIVGPYAALTAKHCGTKPQIDWPFEPTVFSVSNTLANPYADTSLKFAPRWWAALNDEQIANDGRETDWPAQHDQRVIFVPNLTPELIADNLLFRNIGAASIDAHAPTDRQIAVGVCSSNIQCSIREYVDVDYTDSVEDSITDVNRDGYFNFKKDGTFFTGVEGGDSGGPTLGSAITSWPWSYDGEVASHRHVLSTHQGCSSQYSEACHTAPMANNVNISLTPNQAYTVRLNQLWARAAISDADQDGVPYECDSDPSDPASSANSCPTALGTTDIDKPRGLLQCKEGFVATGVKGRAGWMIDELAVRCTPTACLREDAACSEEYWTDHFAGESGSGTAYTRTCDAGKAINYVRGQHTAGTDLFEISLNCYDYDALVDNGTYSGGQSLGIIGNSFGSRNEGTSTGWETCGTDSFLIGFEARSDFEDDQVLKRLTGLQPICSEPIDESPYHGSMGGTLESLKCPANFSGVGFISAPYTQNSDYVGLLGLLCLRDDDIGTTPSDYKLIAAHGSYYTSGYLRPAMVEKYQYFKDEHGLGSSFVESKCPAGSVVTSARLATDLAGDGRFINRFYRFTCRDTATGSTTSVYPMVGAVGGTYATLGCPDSTADTVVGLNLDSGWLTDGVGLVCK